MEHVDRILELIDTILCDCTDSNHWIDTDAFGEVRIDCNCPCPTCREF